MSGLDRMTVPVIQGGMGIGISMGKLAGSVAKEGGMGVISTANIGFREKDFWQNPREADRRALKKEIEKAREIAGNNGLIAINAMVATTNFEEMTKLACETGIDAIIAGAGLPLELPDFVRDYDVMLAPIVSGGRAARLMMNIWKKRFDRRPDFFVVEGSKAGGHLGFTEEEIMRDTESEVDSILCDVIAEAGDIPVFAAGGIFDRDDIERVQSLGARGVQIGTRFIATEECDASQEYKNVIIQAAEQDIMILQSPVGMPGRGLRTPLTRKVSQGQKFPPEICIGCIHSCNPEVSPYCINKALIQGFYGNYEEGLFFCGANVGRVNSMSNVKTLMDELRG